MQDHNLNHTHTLPLQPKDHIDCNRRNKPIAPTGLAGLPRRLPRPVCYRLIGDERRRVGQVGLYTAEVH